MSFIRLKILAIIGGSESPVNKMLAVKASSTWLEFKIQCAQKLGIGGQSTSAESPPLSFYWEGCEIDEEDDKPLAELAKEGDTFVVMQSLLSQSQDVDLGVSVGMDLGVGVGQGEELLSAGPSGRQATSGVRIRTETSSDYSLPAGASRRSQAADLSLAIFGSVDDRGLPSTSSQEKKCTCRNSKCIKLYCICFAGGNLCEGCMCRDCLNAPGNEGFVMSERSKILARNPQAFSVKVEQAGEDSSHKTGCRCRKSRCVKKYCECFDGGVRCNPNCRCIDCANASPDDPDFEQEPEEVHEAVDQALISLDGLASLASAAQIASDCIEDGDAKQSLSPGMLAAVAPYHPEGVERQSPPSDDQQGNVSMSYQGESNRGADLASGSFFDEESLAALAASLSSVPLPEFAPSEAAAASDSASLLQNALQNHLMALIRGQGEGPPGSFLSIPKRQAESVSGHSSQQALPIPPSVQSASPLAPLTTVGAKEGRASSLVVPTFNASDAMDATK